MNSSSVGTVPAADKLKMMKFNEIALSGSNGHMVIVKSSSFPYPGPPSPPLSCNAPLQVDMFPPLMGKICARN